MTQVMVSGFGNGIILVDQGLSHMDRIDTMNQPQRIR